MISEGVKQAIVLSLLIPSKYKSWVIESLVGPVRDIEAGQHLLGEEMDQKTVNQRDQRSLKTLAKAYGEQPERASRISPAPMPLHDRNGMFRYVKVVIDVLDRKPSVRLVVEEAMTTTSQTVSSNPQLLQVIRLMARAIDLRLSAADCADALVMYIEGGNLPEWISNQGESGESNE